MSVPWETAAYHAFRGVRFRFGADGDGWNVRTSLLSAV
jgi:hypothetical protein